MVKKSLIPPVAEGIDLSGIDLKKYERCPLCGRKLKHALTAEKLAANRENLRKRTQKGGRPKKNAGKGEHHEKS